VITDCSNDTQLRAALLAVGPSVITFDCGAGPHVIVLSSYLEIAGEIIVDAEGQQIALSGANNTPLLNVFANADVTLRDLTLAAGIFNGIHPIENVGKLTLINVEVLGNRSDGTGGAIYNDINATLLVRDSRFIDNQSPSTSTTTHGGAIHSVGKATVQNSAFGGNRIISTMGMGGAIAVFGGEFSIEESIFDDNYAPDGGALFVQSGTLVTVTQSLFSANQANYGGAIESQGELQLDYSRLISNTAVNDGGAVWVLSSDLDVTYSTFAGNRAGTTGGAISCYDNNVSIIHSTINGNEAGTEGGGLYSTCDVNLSNTTLHNNAAASGGALHVAGDAFASVAHVTIAQNRAPLGSGIFHNGAGGSSVNLQASMLANNGSANCSGVMVSNGYNLSSDNSCADFVQTGDRGSVALPLGELRANGGSTWTRMPLPPNPAINAIPAGDCSFVVDQRDVARPQRGACDIGAVEVLYSLYLPKLDK
jgi:predicted outer membrane repeat protein